MAGETAPPWSSDRELSLHGVVEILREQFPALADRSVKSLGAGWDSEAFEIDERWIFRFPKRQTVVEHLETEFSVLPLIAPQLPLPVPRPRFRGEASKRFPYPFMGYPKISGEPLEGLPGGVEVDAILDVLLAFLEALHAIPLEGVVAQVRGWPVGEELEARVRRLGLLDDPLVVSSLRRLHREVSPAPQPRLVHDDLGMEHVLIDPQSHEVSGVIDWGDMNIGDPAADFVGLLDWVGDESLREALDRSSYPADPALLDRALLGLIRAHLSNWCDGIEYGTQEMQSEARRALAGWAEA